MFRKIRQYYKDNKQHITPAVSFVKRCIGDLAEMRDKPNLIDYAKFGLSIKENWENAYNLSDPYTYFANNQSWKFVSGDMLGTMICDLIISYQKNRLAPIAVVDSVAAFVGEVEGVRFGWIVYDDHPDKLYVLREHKDAYPKALEKAFWSQYSCHHVVLNIQEEEKIVITEDLDSNDFLAVERAVEASRDIQSFLDKGINRSIIYYGPPGSGKTNIVKNISSILGLRTIRINNLSKFSVEVVLEILRLFNPDAIILEDIDNVSTEDISDILDKVERFNRHQKVTFATANQVIRLDEALIRPGRFDEAIKIDKLDEKIVRKLTDNDEEIIEIVKEWPAAYIAELMKRVQARGKIVALSDYKDLTDRIENLSDAHYELKNPPRMREEMDDEEDFMRTI